MDDKYKYIKLDKVAALFLVIFNFLALITIFDYNEFTEPMIIADLIILVIYKAEKVAGSWIFRKTDIQ